MENSLPGNYGYGSYGYGYPGNTVGLDDLILSNQMANGHQHIGDKIHTASTAGVSETAEVGRDIADGIRDSITANSQLGNINLQATERNGGENRAAIERTSGASISATERNGGAGISATERNGGDTRAAITAQSSTIRDAMNFNANQAQRDSSRIISEICDVRKEMSDGFGDTKLENSKQHCEIKKDVLEASYKSAVQHGDIKLEMCKSNAELARQIDARAAEAAAALAKCCCEQKEEHAKTRDLLSAQSLHSAQSRVSELQNEVNLQRILAGQNSGTGNSGHSFSK